jgi:hypothetical protein
MNDLRNLRINSNLLARTQKNFPVASPENKHFTAVADSPTLYTR